MQDPDAQELEYYDDYEALPAVGLTLLANEVIVEDESEDEIPW